MTRILQAITTEIQAITTLQQYYIQTVQQAITTVQQAILLEDVLNYRKPQLKLISIKSWVEHPTQL